MTDPWQRYYHSQRLRLSYWAWGDERKPVLLLVHGLRDHSRSWDRIARAFCDDFYVVAPDLRGHGESDWATGAHYGLSMFALDLVALIELLGGRASAIAHSMGGRTTLFTAGVYPERFERIVAIEGTGGFSWEPRIGPERMREWAEQTRALEDREPHMYPTFEATIARIERANRRLTRETAEHLARWGARPVDGGFVWKFDPWLYTINDLDVRYPEYPLYWANIEAPVLHLTSSEGGAMRENFEGRPIESYFRDARKVPVPDSGHWIHHDQPDLVIAAAREFLIAPPR